MTQTIENKDSVVEEQANIEQADVVVETPTEVVNTEEVVEEVEPAKEEVVEEIKEEEKEDVSEEDTEEVEETIEPERTIVEAGDIKPSYAYMDRSQLLDEVIILSKERNTLLDQIYAEQRKNSRLEDEITPLQEEIRKLRKFKVEFESDTDRVPVVSEQKIFLAAWNKAMTGSEYDKKLFKDEVELLMRTNTTKEEPKIEIKKAPQRFIPKRL